VYLLNPDTGRSLAEFQSHDLCGAWVSLSRDGRYLATTSDDASVHIWDLKRARTSGH
jgi:WD40 repeat protein